MLIGTQMAYLYIYCNHSTDYAYVLDLNFFGDFPVTIHPLGFYRSHVFE